MKPTASQRRPERARLAAAIERHAEAKAQLERIEQAIAKISDDRVADRTALARARVALEIANAGRSDILISSALDEPVPDLPSPAEAKALLDDCEARLDTSRAALRTLEDEAQRARSSLWLVDTALARAITAAVAVDPALTRLLAEYTRTMARAALLWRSLRSAGAFGIVNTVERVNGEDPAWVDALLALRENPDAILPDLPNDAPLEAARAGGRHAA